MLKTLKYVSITILMLIITFVVMPFISFTLNHGYKVAN